LEGNQTPLLEYLGSHHPAGELSVVTFTGAGIAYGVNIHKKRAAEKFNANAENVFSEYVKLVEENLKVDGALTREACLRRTNEEAARILERDVGIGYEYEYVDPEEKKDLETYRKEQKEQYPGFEFTWMDDTPDGKKVLQKKNIKHNKKGLREKYRNIE